MANTPISGLTASATNLAAADVLPVVQTTGVGPVKMTGQQLAGGLLGSTTLSGATVTTSQPVFDLSQTWNASGVTFTGLKFNAAGSSDANSASGSLLLDLQVGASSRFQVAKSGEIRLPVGSSSARFRGEANTGGIFSIGATFVFGYSSVEYGVGLQVRSDGAYSWSSNANFNTPTNIDLYLTRRGAANLRLGAADAAAPVAQTLSVQSVVAGTSNTAGANLTITGSQGTGTGAGGSIIFQVAPAGSSGTAQNALQSYITINPTRGSTASSSSVAPTLAFANDGGTGLTGIGTPYSSQLFFYCGGFIAFRILNQVAQVPSTGEFGWNSDNSFTGNNDVRLFRDAANTLALRNGGTSGTPVPQTFRVYNWTDGTNGEFGGIRWASNVFTIGPQTAGTGTARATSFVDGGGIERINIAATSGVVLVADMQLITASSISYIGAGSSGFTLRYSSNSDSNMMVRFAGITSSFPALKRSSTILQARLADDSGYTTMDAQMRMQGTAPAANNSTGTAGDIRYDADYIYVCTAANTWKRVAIATWP